MPRQDRSAEATARPLPLEAEELETLIADFSSALRGGVGSLFVGAGISRGAGLPDWLELLSGPAKELGIRLDINDDLAAVAQYYVNHCTCNRWLLVRAVVDQIANRRRLSPVHEAISRMNVSSVWTTNYDTLLEQAFEGFTLSVRVKDDEIRRTVPIHDREVVKLHGCITRAEEGLVITREDYEDYFQDRPGIAQRFETALQDRMFLFLGYSYRDPNIQSIVTRARRILKGTTRKHYMLQFQEKEPGRAERQRLWARDLKRSGIVCVIVEGEGQIQAALARIAELSRGPTVFVTGSHDADGAARATRFAQQMGQLLARHSGIVLLDGQSSGVGRAAVNSFMTQGIDDKIDMERRRRVFPNPYAADPRFSNDAGLIPMLKQWRRELMQAAAVVIAVDGGMGTRAELELARERGCRVIPIATRAGSAASEAINDAKALSWLKKHDSRFLEKLSARRATVKDVVFAVASALEIERCVAPGTPPPSAKSPAVSVPRAARRSKRRR